MSLRSLFANFAALTAVVFAAVSFGYAQRAATAPKPAPRPMIFAVLNDGASLEPIALVEKKELKAPVSGSDELSLIQAFNREFYGAKQTYRVIFGGTNAGTVTVNSADASAECAKNVASVTTTSTRVTPKGHLMALATNAAVSKEASGTRRMPTWPERNELDVLIRAEFAKNSVPVTKLDYHNLTALDVDNDKKAELVGSFWVENEPKARTLLFFIAEKGSDGKYAIVHSDLRTINEDEVLNGEISVLDDGVYHELLLDVFDYDGDGVAEVFTFVRAFEGSGFNVYKRTDGKWTKVFEGSNYHCGF